MNLVPNGNRVLIKPDQPEEKTKSGIFLPATVQEVPLRGEVVAIGNGSDGNIMRIVAGDTVYYSRYSGAILEHEGEKYLIMKEEDVLAIIND